MQQLKIRKSITSRDSAAIEKYLAAISQEELLSPEEEVALAAKIKQGDERAREKLIRANLRFVVSVAKQYQNSGMQLNDVINEGNVGLIKAASKFDATRGFKFISYAVWWIRQSIIAALAEHARQVRIPLNKVGLTNRLNKASNDFLMKYEREPTDEELAEIANESLDHVISARVSSLRVTSFDAPIDMSNGDTASRYDTIADEKIKQPDEKMVHDESLQKEMQLALCVLNPKEKQVIMFSFGIGYDRQYGLDEIGEILGCVRERARQIKDKALRKLKQNPTSVGLLKKYLGT